MSGGTCFINVGGTGTGKTTYTMRFLKRLPMDTNLLIHDINNEYSEYHDKGYLHANDFLALAVACINTVIICEEATIFFNNKGMSEQLQEVLVRKRHTNNIIIMNFHSLRTVPRYVYDLTNYVIVHKTKDSPKLIDQKFGDSDLSKVVEYVQKSKNPYEEYQYKLY